MGISILSSQKVRDVKRMIWEGVSQREVAQWAGVTQATISRIVTGEQWFQVPWPDGSVGCIPVEQRVRLHIAKYSRKSAEKTYQHEIEHQEETPLMQIAGAVEQEIDDAIEDSLKRTVRVDGGDDGSLLPSSREGADDLPPVHPVFVQERWAAVLKLAPNNALVKGASGDKLRKAVIVEVFSNLPEQEWGKPIAVKLVEEVYKRYKPND